MSKFVIICVLVGFAFIGRSQDLIYTTDRNVYRGKVIEVTLDKVRYKKAEIPHGPAYEISKADIVKIQYSNGFVDVLQKDKEKEMAKSMDSIARVGPPRSRDSSDFALIYVVYNYGMDENQPFPIYFNGNLVATMRNHMRMTYKIYSQGVLTIERRGLSVDPSRHGNITGPRVELPIKNGVSYGVRIEVPNPQAMDPNKRFSLKSFNDDQQFKDFLENDFYSFEPFKGAVLNIAEDKQVPVIKQ